MRGLQLEDRRRQSFHPGLELQGKIVRIVPALVQVAAVDPQVLHVGGLPHVAQFPLPRPRILRRIRSEPPALADGVRHLGRDQISQPAVHRPIPRGVNNDVGIQLRSVGHHDGVAGDLADLAIGQLDPAVDDQLRGADVDVVAGAAPQVLQEQAGAVNAEVQVKAGSRELGVELRVPAGHLRINRNLGFGQNPVRQGGKQQVGFLRGDAVGQRLFGVQPAESQVHEGFAAGNMRRGPLDHGDVRAVFPKVGANIVGRIVGADDHGFLAGPVATARVLGRVVLLPQEGLGAVERGDARVPRYTQGEDELLRAQGDRFAVAHHLHHPLLGRFVEAGVGALGFGPVVQFHDPCVVFQPVADLVLGRENRPVVDWLENYTRIMELNYWSKTECTNARFDETSQEWVVEVMRDGEPVTLRPKQLVFALGVSGYPSVPTFDGAESFLGEQYHSSKHPGGGDWTGKKAVVIGSNNSAHDICADLWEHGADVTMVQRSSTHIARSESLMDLALGDLYSERALAAGVTTEKADLLFASLPMRILPEAQGPVYQEMAKRDADFYSQLEAAGFDLDFGVDGSGLFLKYLRRGSGYYIDVGASQLIIDGRVKLRSGEVAKITGNAVVLG